MRKLVLLMVLFVAPLFGAEKLEPERGKDMLRTLKREHPRLFLSVERLDELKKLHQTDKVLQKCVREVLNGADKTLKKEPLKHILRGPRLLHVSRDCLNRVSYQAFAYRWTGDAKYAKAAVVNMLTVCAFKDWNPSHFLDTAEMSCAVGIGYDWLYDFMDKPTRKKIRDGLIKNGLKEGLKAYKSPMRFVKNENNWNQVCNGGLLTGALSIADEEPDYAEKILPAAVKSLPRALKSYAPDGAWAEGVGYWNYATDYTAYAIDALETALGTDFDLSKVEGLSEAGLFPVYATGPTLQMLQYADVGTGDQRGSMAPMFWLARKYGNQFLADDEHKFLKLRNARVMHVVWYVAPSEKKYPRKLDRLFRGKVPVAVMRSSWDDPDALFIGIKAGFNQAAHGHLDLGTFELDALGERWAIELGSDDYNLPGYWSMGRGGKRWSYYRLNSFSHNVPLVGNKNQDPVAKSEILGTQFSDADAAKDGFVQIDLTSCYPGANKVVRTAGLVASRRAALIHDRFELKKTDFVSWGMMTKAKVTIRADGSAILEQNKQRLVIRALQPADAKFVVKSAKQKPPQKDNKGVSRLELEITDAPLSLKIVVLLSPEWKNGGSVKKYNLKELGEFLK